MLLESYVRVEAALDKACSNFVPATIVGSTQLATPSLVMHTEVPFDLTRRAKLAELLGIHASNSQPKARMGNFDYDQLRLNLLHDLRHGGATHDRRSGARTLEEVRRRESSAFHSTAVVGRLLQTLPAQKLVQL